MDKVDRAVNTDTWRCEIVRKVIEHFASMMNLRHPALSILRIFLHCKSRKGIGKILYGQCGHVKTVA